MLFESERYMFIAGPIGGTRERLTHAEDLRICNQYEGGQYVPAGVGDDNGHFASRREWIPDPISLGE